MGKCIVKNCTNYHGKKILDKKVKYFSFPKDPKLLAKWLRVCDRPEIWDWNTNFVCSDHFEESDYALKGVLLDLPMSKRHLKEEAIPTKNIVLSAKQRRQIKREKIKEKKLLVEQALRSYENPQYDDHVPPFSEFKGMQTTSQMTIEILEPLGEVEEGYHMKETSNKAVQTEIDIECAREFHIMTLEAQLRKYKSAYKTLLKEKNSQANLNDKLREMFTPGQIRKISEPLKTFKWKHEDITEAMALYTAGPTSYKLLRNRGFPLPCPSTLTKWAAKFKITQNVDEEYDEQFEEELNPDE